MKAIIISVGDELVYGKTINTNSAWLAQKLGECGIETLSHHTVGDDRPKIADIISRSAGIADYVIITGGLGPTLDDLTRFALADVMGVDVVLDQISLAEIMEFFAKRNRSMNETNRVQAMIPQGARALKNTMGTAPGIAADFGGAKIFVMPGVPYEMKQMFETQILPAFPRLNGALTQIIVHTFGMGESDVGDMISDLMTPRDQAIKVGTTVADGLVSVRITVTHSQDDLQASAYAQRIADEVSSRLGDIVIGTGEDTIQSVVGRLVKQKRKTLATAESCTGGLVGELVTAVSGSSEYYLGGFITYSNLMKETLLGVRHETLLAHGAVSEQVAAEMALGAKQKTGADYALSLTGVAGPTGGTDAKPVGLVYMGLAKPDGVEVHKYLFPGSRAAVRLRSALAGLNYLRLELKR